MAGIWSELLEQGEIGPEDDFFELGGDSLLAVWLMEEITERTGRELPLSLLLEGATIRHLASALDAHGSTTWHLEGDQCSWNAMSALLDPWVG